MTAGRHARISTGGKAPRPGSSRAANINNVETNAPEDVEERYPDGPDEATHTITRSGKRLNDAGDDPVTPPKKSRLGSAFVNDGVSPVKLPTSDDGVIEDVPIRKSLRKSVPSTKANEANVNRVQSIEKSGIPLNIQTSASSSMAMEDNIPDEHRDRIGKMVREELARLKIPKKEKTLAAPIKSYVDPAHDVTTEAEDDPTEHVRTAIILTDDEGYDEGAQSDSATVSDQMSNGEQQPVRTVRRTNGAKKAAVAPDRAPNSPLTAEDIAALDEEARLTKIALWVYLAMFFDRANRLKVLRKPTPETGLSDYGVHPEAVRGQHKKSNRRATVEDVEDEDSDTTSKRNGKKAGVNSIIEDNEDDDNEEMSYLEDTEARGLPGPAMCEVSDVNDQDPIIRYHNLPPLRGGREFVSWSPTPGLGLVVPSAWPDQVEKMSMSQLRSVIEFKQHGTFFNPSRADPAAMGRSPATGNSYLTLPGQPQSFLTLTTCVMTTSSNIVHPKEAAILTVFHEDTARAQIAQDAITFLTAKTAVGASGGSPAKNPSKMFRQAAGTGSSASVFARPRQNLQGVQTVPVLDARGT